MTNLPPWCLFGRTNRVDKTPKKLFSFGIRSLAQKVEVRPAVLAAVGSSLLLEASRAFCPASVPAAPDVGVERLRAHLPAGVLLLPRLPAPAGRAPPRMVRDCCVTPRLLGRSRMEFRQCCDIATMFVI